MKSSEFCKVPIESSSSFATELLARALIGTGQTTAALPVVEALRAEPYAAAATLGDLLARVGKPGEAAALSRTIHEESGLEALGFSLAETGAISSARQIADQMKDGPDQKRLLAMCSIMTGDLPTAWDMIRGADDLRSSELAQPFLRELKKKGNASEIQRVVSEVAKTKGPHPREIASLLVASGRLKDGIEAYNKIDDPHIKPGVASELLPALFKAGQADEAAVILSDAKRNAAGDASSLSELAGAMVLAGKQGEAQSLFSNALTAAGKRSDGYAGFLDLIVSARNVMNLRDDPTAKGFIGQSLDAAKGTLQRRDSPCREMASVARTYAMARQYADAKRTIDTSCAGAGQEVWRLYAYAMILLAYAGESHPGFFDTMSPKVDAALSVMFEVRVPF